VQNVLLRLLSIIVLPQNGGINSVYSMLQNRRKEESIQSPGPSGKVTDTEGDDGRRRREERTRAKSFGIGDELKLRNVYRRESEGRTIKV
jgi:hypothetical protein